MPPARERKLLAKAASSMLALGLLTSATAQEHDVTFFVIGKHANFQQDVSGQRDSIDFSFFSEIFLTGDGDASAATLTFPTGELIAFVDKRNATDSSRDNLLLVSGKDRFTSYADLQGRYPDGRYRVSFDTPSGSVKDGPLLFATRGLPVPPRIHLQQGGSVKDSYVNAGVDLRVSWSAFSEGRADQRGILDDLVFVILEDKDGNRVAHSGRPFENRPYLTYASENFTIDGGVLEAGENYTLSVEHAILDDTRTFGGVPAMTTRAVTTKLAISARSK